MKQNRIAEIICFIIFIICTITMCIFHEPWLDEFQSWAISQDSLYNILFVIPHYEGHPFLWHLILKCFSFFNVKAEVGLKISNLLFIYGAVWLLLFKSPFIRPVKCILPFTYFLFYQYAIVNRPYSILSFSIFLSAILYKDRNIKPFRFICSLILLCFTCAYGMVISAGIIVVWFLELVKNKQILFKEFFKDKRILSMSLITFVCFILAVMIFPNKNVIHMEQFSGFTSLKFLYVFFIMPLDTLFTNICYSVSKIDSINILWCLVSAFLYIFFYKIFKFYKSAILFFIPFFMFLLTAFSLYIEVHHIGILTLFYIFVFWCIFADSHKILPVLYKKVCTFILILSFIVQIYWSICAYITDFKFDYSPSRKLAKVIKEYKLDKYNIKTGFKYKKTYIDKVTGKVIPSNKGNDKSYYVVSDIDYNIQMMPVFILPYFKDNIFYSFNMDNQNRRYIIWEKLTQSENERLKNKIREKGLPEILLFIPSDLLLLFSPDEIKNTEYVLLELCKGYRVWKNITLDGTIPVYIKADIYDEIVKNKE